MKIESIIKRIKQYNQYHHDEHLDKAVEILEKQIEFMPIDGINKLYPTLGRNYYCKCGVMFMDWENNSTNYCGNCGQKLRRINENKID